MIRLNIATLSMGCWAAGLILSFCTYFFPSSAVIQVVPPFCLMLCAVVKLLILPPEAAQNIYTLGLQWDRLLLWAGIPALAALSSLINSIIQNEILWVSLGHVALLMVTILSLLVLIGGENPEKGLLGIFIAGLFCVLIYFVLGDFSVAFVTGYRLGGSFHPNLAAFIFLGFSGAGVWFFFRFRKFRLFPLVFMAMCLAIIFATGSRGSLVAFFLATLAVTLITGTKFLSEIATAKGMSPMIMRQIFWVLVGMGFLVLWIFWKFEWNQISEYLDDKLHLTHPVRGLDSGLTGRIFIWKELIPELQAGAWLLGIGYRQSLEVFGVIDNGYLVVLYETGIIPFLILLLLLSRRASQVWKLLWYPTTHPMFSVGISIVFLLVGFLTNNLTARFLLSLGNPFGLIALFILVVHVIPVDGKAAYIFKSGKQ